MQEIRQTLRSLWRDKGFTAVAIAMLALGIGATTAIFSVVNSILLKPLPYPDPDRLHLVNETDRELADEYPVLPVNARHVDDWRRACDACESFGLFQAGGGPLAGDVPPEFLQILRVSHDGESGVSVLRLIQGQGMRPVLAELAAGLAVAALLGRSLESLLFGVSAFDMRVYAAATAAVALASILACYLPARRAAQVHPAIALRSE